MLSNLIVFQGTKAIESITAQKVEVSLFQSWKRVDGLVIMQGSPTTVLQGNRIFLRAKWMLLATIANFFSVSVADIVVKVNCLHFAIVFQIPYHSLIFLVKSDPKGNTDSQGAKIGHI